MKNNIFSF